jgi:hypothetical protein
VTTPVEPPALGPGDPNLGADPRLIRLLARMALHLLEGLDRTGSGLDPDGPAMKTRIVPQAGSGGGRMATRGAGDTDGRATPAPR